MKEHYKKLYKDGEIEYFKYLKKILLSNRKKIIVTVNPETLMQSKNDNKINEMLKHEEISLVPDGISVVKKARLNKSKIKSRITGIDISNELLFLCNKYKKSMCIFGADEVTLKKAIKKIKKDYPQIKILGYQNGFVENKELEFQKLIKLKPNVCLVALGIPLQEKLIYGNYEYIDNGIYIGVGGSIDVISGSKKRAPKLFVKMNCEWLYRIITEPKRIKRFVKNNIVFILKR